MQRDLTFLHLHKKPDFDIPKQNLFLHTLTLQNCQFIIYNYYKPYQNGEKYDILIYKIPYQYYFKTKHPHETLKS